MSTPSPPRQTTTTPPRGALAIELQFDCAGCLHFERDTINPPQGMGRCTLGLGYWHPHARHWCAEKAMEATA